MDLGRGGAGALLEKVRAGAGMRHLDFILEVGKDTNGHQAGD